MDQRISFLTIGVNNLDEMKTFYRDKFGWTTLKESDGIVFFKLNGIILGLFPDPELAADIGIPQTEIANNFKHFTLALNFNSEKEVNDAFQMLKSKGVKVVREPEHVSWGGYRGYIADVENNYWELAYNPFLKMDENGNVLTHE